MSDPQHVEVGRFYTLARRFPILIGKLDAGTRLPFGPYTVAQVLGLVLVVYVLQRTYTWWLALPLPWPLFIAIGVPVGTAIGLRKLPITGRGLISTLESLVNLLTSPSGGRINQRTPVLRRPYRVAGPTFALAARHEVPKARTTPPPPAPARQPSPSPLAPLPVPAAVRTERRGSALAVTGVSRLLASAVSRADDAQEARR